MLKYVNYEVVFAEIPDEISLAINISNCPCKCPGCHSSYLAEDIGERLRYDNLISLIHKNKGITCVAFMGGDADPLSVNAYASIIKEQFPNLKVAWYSGRQELSKDIELNNFDFIKIGPYVEQSGPLNNPNTNQIMYKVVHKSGKNVLLNITNKFWKES
nr:MAG TPA: anaerobic ribonucleoside-triphosphate reductase activating protein [Bacteriophage sp.]